MRVLPPLKQLKAFEAVARHLSFTKAADELCVTPGALTKHIQSLEVFYDVKLIDRRKKQIGLTSFGEMLFTSATQAFEIISKASNQLKCHSPELRIKVFHSFAIRWLLSRLKIFDDIHPEVNMRLTISSKDVHISSEEFDAAIIYSADPPENCLYLELFKEQLCPVCSPSILPPKGKIELIEMKQQKIILSTIDGQDWQKWAKVYDVPDLQINTELRFEYDDAAIQASVEGHGIVLANLLYIETELQLGTLKFATDMPPISLGSHYLIYSDKMEEKTEFVTFINWMQSIVKKAAIPLPFKPTITELSK